MPQRKRATTALDLAGTAQRRAVRIFLGAASEHDRALLALASELKHYAQVESWRTFFHEGVSTLETLRRAATEVDFAAFLWGTEDRTTSRRKATASPRDNVIYEAGLFAGYLGPERTLVVVDPDTKLPSDVLGITNIPWTSVKDVVARIRNAMRRMGPAPTSRIQGDWWQFVTSGYEASSVISFFTIVVRPDTRVVAMQGMSWNREGLQVATWKCPAAALDEQTMTLHYSWEGLHTAEENLPTYFGTGEIVFRHDPFVGSFSSTSFYSDRRAVRRTARYMRAVPSDAVILNGTDANAQRRLIADRLRRRAALPAS